MQMLSSGVLKSNYHRVRMPEAHEPQGMTCSILTTVESLDELISAANAGALHYRGLHT